MENLQKQVNQIFQNYIHVHLIRIYFYNLLNVFEILWICVNIRIDNCSPEYTYFIINEYPR